MKDRIICVLIICVLGAVSFRLFFQKSNEEIEFKNYMKDEYTKIFEIEEELGDSYESVLKKYTGETDDFIQNVNDILLVYSQQLVDTAESIHITDPDLKRVHTIYLDAVKEENEGLKYFQVAKEKKKSSLYATAWDKIASANLKKKNYFNTLKEMAESHYIKANIKDSLRNFDSELAFDTRPGSKQLIQ